MASDAIAVVQTAQGVDPGSMSFANPVAAGNSLVVLLIGYVIGAFPAYSPDMYAPVSYNGAAVDGAVPLWDQSGIGANIVNSVSNSFDAVVAGWLIPNVASGNTVAATATGVTGNGFVMYEVSGLGTDPVVDKSAFTHGSVGGDSSGAMPAITSAPAFVVGCAGDTAGVSVPGSGGWTIAPSPGGFCQVGSQVAMSVGGAYSWDAIGEGGNWASAVASIAQTVAVISPDTRDPNDIAWRIKDGLLANAADWIPSVYVGRSWDSAPTLHVSDNYVPSDDAPAVLIVDDGGPPMFGSSWFINSPRLPLLRFTAFTKGRKAAWDLVKAAANWVNNNPAAVGITLVNDVSDPLITRDSATGAYLASITMPTIVRPK